MLQGVTSFQLVATPTWGLSQSSSVIPTARSMARAGARSYPAVTSRLRRSMATMLAQVGGSRETAESRPWNRLIGRP